MISLDLILKHVQVDTYIFRKYLPELITHLISPTLPNFMHRNVALPSNIISCNNIVPWKTTKKRLTQINLALSIRNEKRGHKIVPNTQTTSIKSN